MDVLGPTGRHPAPKASDHASRTGGRNTALAAVACREREREAVIMVKMALVMTSTTMTMRRLMMVMAKKTTPIATTALAFARNHILLECN